MEKVYSPALCQERHERLNARIQQLETIVIANEDGLVTKTAVNHAAIETLAREIGKLVAVVETIARSQNTEVAAMRAQLNRMVGGLLLAQILIVPMVLYGLQRALSSQ